MTNECAWEGAGKTPPNAYSISLKFRRRNLQASALEVIGGAF